jgi:hypothetical protein
MFKLIYPLTFILGITSPIPRKPVPPVSEPEVVTITLQPGPAEGQDCLVIYRETDNGLYARTNQNFQKEFGAACWTYASQDAGEGTTRAYLNFTRLKKLPEGTIIKSARLSLYGITVSVPHPQGNSWYRGAPSYYEENSCWIRRVTGEWDQKTINWNNKPGMTEEHKVALPASTSKWNFDAVDIDVTQLVKDMVNKMQVYGFGIALRSEKTLRCISFGSCERTDNPARRPKLVLQCISPKR